MGGGQFWGHFEWVTDWWHELAYLKILKLSEFICKYYIYIYIIYMDEKIKKYHFSKISGSTSEYFITASHYLMHFNATITFNISIPQLI